MKSKEDIIQILSSYNFGLKRKSVNIEPPHPKWPTAFEFIKDILKSVLKNQNYFQIEHVGSTSIPDLSAKPILDILLIFKNFEDSKKSISLIEKLGFTYKGDAINKMKKIEADPGRHFFSFYNNLETIDFIHLHVFCESHPDVQRLLAFRNALRMNQNIKEEYQKLKINLWQEGRARHDYTCSKDDFIDDVINFKNSYTSIVSEKEFVGFSKKVEGACCFLFIQDKILYLKKTRIWPGKWCVPGGKLDPNETPEGALIREFFEETAIDLKKHPLLDEKKLYVRNYWGDYILHTYVVKMDFFPKVNLNEEHSEYRWVNFEEAKQLDKMPGHVDPLVTHSQLFYLESFLTAPKKQ